MILQRQEKMIKRLNNKVVKGNKIYVTLSLEATQRAKKNATAVKRKKVSRKKYDGAKKAP